MELKRVTSLVSTVVAAAAGLGLGGCASDLKQAQLHVAQIADLLPGHYSNAAQVAADVKAGRQPHDAKSIDIVRLDLPLLSDYAFYAQEMSLGDSQRIVSQRLFTFEPVKDGVVIQRLYTFAQPGRWRGGLSDPSVFTGMMYNDMNAMAGCELAWKKEGDKFVATNNGETCRTSVPSVGTARTVMKAELSGDDLSIAELAYTPGGKLVQGNAAEPFNRYERGAP